MNLIEQWQAARKRQRDARRARSAARAQSEAIYAGTLQEAAKAVTMAPKREGTGKRRGLLDGLLRGLRFIGQR